MITSPIILHPVTREHLEAGVAIHCNPETNRFNPFGPPTPERFEQALLDWISHWENYDFGYWAVSLMQAPKQIVGFGGVMDTMVGTQIGLNLYFRLSPSVWGIGVGTAIAEAGLHQAFIQQQRDTVLGLVRPKNLPSRKTLEKVGMLAFDTCKDIPDHEPSLIYRITAQEYANRKK